MADVLVREGRGYLRHPQTGMVVPVPEAELADALAAGFEPTSTEEFQRQRRQEEFGGTGGTIKAGLAGVARGATLGTSDALLQGLVDPETLRGLREANPLASGLGDVIGTAGSMFVPGAPLARVTQGAVKVGEGTTALAARLLGSSAGRAAPRFAGALAREGLIGATVGAGQGVSDIALSPELLTPGEQAARLLSSAGKGAAVGAGLGGLSWLGQTGMARIRDRYTLGLREIKALRGEKTALEAERTAMEASGASGEQMARLDAQLSSVAQDLHERQIGAVGKLFTRAAAFGIGHAIGGGMTGGLIGILVAPRAMRALTAALEPLGVKAGEAMGRVKEAAAPYLDAAWSAVKEPVEAAWNRVAPYVERAAQSPLGQAAIETASPYVAEAAAGAAGKVAAKLGGLAAKIPDEVASGAMVAGLQGAALGYAAHRLTMPIGHAVEVLTKKVAPAARLALLDTMTSDDWRHAADELANVQPAQIDLAIRAGLPESTPQDAKNAVVQRLQAAVRHLQGLQTPSTDGEQVPISAAPREGAKEGARQATEKTLKAIVQPGTVIQDFVDQTLTPEQVKAWEAVYPEALAQIRSIVDAGVTRAKSRGGHFSRKRAEQIAILKGTPGAAPRLAQPATVARIQAMHQATRAQRQGSRASGRSLNLAKNYMTPMQRIGSGR